MYYVELHNIWGHSGDILGTNQIFPYPNIKKICSQRFFKKFESQQSRRFQDH